MHDNNEELFYNLRKNGVVIWLFNIGCERYWGRASYAIMDRTGESIVNCIEELNLLLAYDADYVILRSEPDKKYREDLSDLSGTFPNILSLSIEDDKKTISELVLLDRKLLDELFGLSVQYKNAYLIPFGVTSLEEEIAERCGLIIPFSKAEIFGKINNKIYIRKMFENTAIPIPEGHVCYTIQEIYEAYEKLLENHSFIIVKQPDNASGKGLFLIDQPRKLHTIIKIIDRFSNYNTGWIVEGWYRKKVDLNVQMNISMDGDIKILSIKEQMIDKTVYKGSILPPRISEEYVEQYFDYARTIGAVLNSDGYYGMVGVDSIITINNELLPLIEVNGRLTLSTYIYNLEKRYSNRIIYFCYKTLYNKNANYQNIKENLVDYGLWFDYRIKKGIQCITYRSLIYEERKRLFFIIIAETYDDVYRYINQLNYTLNKIRGGK